MKGGCGVSAILLGFMIGAVAAHAVVVVLWAACALAGMIERKQERL